MARFCPFFHQVAYKETTPGTVMMFRLRCKSWQCEYCAKINRSEWLKHLRKKIPRVADNWWFVTITAHENTRSEELSLNNIRSNIDRLFKRVNRVWSHVDYVRVYEQHKTGAYHAHMAVSNLSARVQKHTAPNGVDYYRPAIQERYIGNIAVRTWWRRTCRSMGMGYKVDVSEVQEVGRVTRYVVKYLTKETQGYYAKGLRRIQTSRRVGSPRRAKDGGWSVGARVFQQVLPPLSHLYDADKKLQVPDAYWQTNLTYPAPNETD